MRCHPLELPFSGTLWVPILDPRGSHVPPLAPICGSSGLHFGPFWVSLPLFWLPLAPFWFPLVSLGSLLVPFWLPLVPFWFLLPVGFLLVPFWIPLPPIWLPLAPFWLHLVSLWLSFGSLWLRSGPVWLPWPRSGSLLAMRGLCNDRTIRYIYNNRNKTHLHVCS